MNDKDLGTEKNTLVVDKEVFQFRAPAPLYKATFSLQTTTYERQPSSDSDGNDPELFQVRISLVRVGVIQAHKDKAKVKSIQVDQFRNFVYSVGEDKYLSVSKFKQ